MWLLAISVTILAIWCSQRLIQLLYARHITWRQFPGPRCDSLMYGNSGALRKAQADDKFVDLLQRWVKENGKTFLYWRAMNPIVFTTSPTVLDSIWSNLNSYQKLQRLPNRALFDERITGANSFLTATGGTLWATKRKSLSPFFTKANMVDIFPQAQALVNESIIGLREIHGSGEKPFDMELGFATMAELLLIVCGMDKLSPIFTENPGYLAKNVINLLEVIPKQFQYLKDSWKLKQMDECQIGMKFIKKTRIELTAAFSQLQLAMKANADDEEYMNSLGMLPVLMATNTYDSEGAEDFVDDIMTLILVADNISKVVSIMLAKVLREPEVMAKMVEECRSVEINKFEDLKKLKYTEMVMLEAMRWSPILQRGARQLLPQSSELVNGKIDFDGMKVPVTGKFVDIQWSQYIMHHDQDLWDKPSEFRPERFKNGTNDFVRNSYIPFIAGPRSCLGKHLGIMKTKLMVYGMVRNFDMSIIPGEETLVLDKKYTIVKVRQGKNCTLKSI